MIADGRVRPVVHATFPMDRAADAHRQLEAGGVVGKLLLEVPAAEACRTSRTTVAAAG